MLEHRLRTLRKQKDMTQEEVADRLHISRKAYGHYETGKREPSIQTLREIASIYEVNISSLFEDDSSGQE